MNSNKVPIGKLYHFRIFSEDPRPQHLLRGLGFISCRSVLPGCRLEHQTRGGVYSPTGRTNPGVRERRYPPRGFQSRWTINQFRGQYSATVPSPENHRPGSRRTWVSHRKPWKQTGQRGRSIRGRASHQCFYSRYGGGEWPCGFLSQWRSDPAWVLGRK